MLLLSFSVNTNGYMSIESNDKPTVTMSWTINTKATMEAKKEEMKATMEAKKEEMKATMEAKKEEMKATMEAKKEEMKKARFETKEFISLNRIEQKKNIELFRTENKIEIKDTIKALDKEIKDSLKTLREEKKAELDKIVEQIKSKETSFEEKQVLTKKLEELRIAYYTKLKTLLSSNSGALELISEREAVFEQNKELREQNSLKRKELHDKIKDKVVAYKEAFIAKIGSKIETIPTDKLPKLVELIEKLQAKNENNAKKEAFIAQLEALKQIINDKISLSDLSEEISLDDIIE